MSEKKNTPLDVESIRGDFPILKTLSASGAPLIYLDNAASTQHPNVVIESISDCYRNYYANVHRGIHTLSEAATSAYEQSRHAVAAFLNAAADREIVFTAGTTAAINTVARSWGEANIKSGDTILLTIAEHHANIVPWQQLATRTGCRIEFLPVADDGTIADEVVLDALAKHRPKLFTFVAISNMLGTEFPVARWVRMAHDAESLVLVDAAQAVPHQPIDVRQWDADFVVFSGHKICGPSGIGVLYGRESLLEAMPPFLGGGGMIQRVTVSGFEPAGLPEKFEAGTPPITEAIGLAAAIRYVESIGLECIRAHEQELVGRAYDGLAAIDGVRIFGPLPKDRAGILSFVIDGVHAHDVSQWLDTRGIAVRAGHHCTMPLHKRFGVAATSRASFYLYNTVSEVDAFVAAIAETKAKFSSTGRRRTRQPIKPL